MADKGPLVVHTIGSGIACKKGTSLDLQIVYWEGGRGWERFSRFLMGSFSAFIRGALNAIILCQKGRGNQA